MQVSPLRRCAPSVEMTALRQEAIEMAEQSPLKFVFYIAAPAEKVWEGFVSPESNRVLFGADLEADLKPGGQRSEERRVGKECW